MKAPSREGAGRVSFPAKTKCRECGEPAVMKAIYEDEMTVQIYDNPPIVSLVDREGDYCRTHGLAQRAQSLT